MPRNLNKKLGCKDARYANIFRKVSGKVCKFGLRKAKKRQDSSNYSAEEASSRNNLEGVMDVVSSHSLMTSSKEGARHLLANTQFQVSVQSTEFLQKSLTSKTLFMVKVIPFDGLVLFLENLEVQNLELRKTSFTGGCVSRTPLSCRKFSL